jgi:hypothetical protein
VTKSHYWPGSSIIKSHANGFTIPTISKPVQPAKNRRNVLATAKNQISIESRSDGDKRTAMKMASI